MKKTYLLVAGALLTTLGANAQNFSLKHQDRQNFTTEFRAGETLRPGTGSDDRLADDIIWENNFDDAGTWIAAGPAADYEVNGWSIGTTTLGWYFGTGEDMGTEGNFARFVNGDPTAAPAPVEDGPFTLTYDGTIDLSGVPAPHFEFEQYGARFLTLQAIEVSTDDGASWVEVGNNDDIPPVTLEGGDVYDKPDTKRFNITAAIAPDPSNVMVRFFWDGALNGGDINFVEYGWFVDNARIVEGHEFDSEITASYFRTGVGVSFDAGLEYYQVPIDQAAGINFSAEMINQGGSTFENVALNVNVDRAGSSVFSCTSGGADVPSTEGDSLGCDTGYTPDELGTYEMSWIFLGDGADTYNDNDEMVDEFEVTDHVYARDNGVATGAITNWSGSTGQPFSIGNGFDIFVADEVGAIEVEISDATENVGELIYGQLLIFSEGVGDFVFAYQTDDHQITAAENGGVIRLVFDEVVEVAEGDLVLAVVGHYGGNDVGIGLAQSAEEAVWGFNAANERLGLADADAAMVRLHMRSYVGLEEDVTNNFSIGQNMPNPFGLNSVINYELSEAAEVSVEFVDVSGKVVKSINNGTQDAGTYTLDLDAADFAEGVYFYTFSVGAEKVTKRMVIAK